MKILTQQSKFTSMLQDGPFGMGPEPPFEHPFYLDYMYQRDVSHDEYEVKRIFDTGVA